MSLTTSTPIDTIVRKVQKNSRNMTNDNESRFFVMSETILTKKNYVFNYTKRTLLIQEKHRSLLKVPGNYAFHVVLESYALQTWGLLWCFYSDGLSVQLITPVQPFKFDNSSFLHTSFSTHALGSVLYNILDQKMVEYRPTSDTSFLRIECAYFTQLSQCFDNSGDVFGIMIFDELVKNLSWRYTRVSESVF
jgi:hypothetical protein